MRRLSYTTRLYDEVIFSYKNDLIFLWAIPRALLVYSTQNNINHLCSQIFTRFMLKETIKALYVHVKEAWLKSNDEGTNFKA